MKDGKGEGLGHDGPACGPWSRQTTANVPDGSWARSETAATTWTRQETTATTWSRQTTVNTPDGAWARQETTATSASCGSWSGLLRVPGSRFSACSVSSRQAATQREQESCSVRGGSLLLPGELEIMVRADTEVAAAGVRQFFAAIATGELEEILTESRTRLLRATVMNYCQDSVAVFLEARVWHYEEASCTSICLRHVSKSDVVGFSKIALALVSPLRSLGLDLSRQPEGASCELVPFDDSDFLPDAAAADDGDVGRSCFAGFAAPMAPRSLAAAGLI